MLLAMGLTVVLIGAYALVVPRVKYSKCRLNEKKLLRVLEQYQNLLCEERKQLKVARKNEHKKLETLQDQLENNLKILGTDHLYLYEKTQKKLAEVKNKISTLNREDQEEQERLKAELEHSQKVFQEMIAEMEEKQRKKAEKLEQKSREKAEKPFQNATPQSIFLESLFRDRD
ncbi:MAG: hypothetical protein LBG52_06275 [Candidatus Peribacteria bacterium]|nr:hypothetical protein [Candidatus Peribacteria bacterium]